MVGECFRQRRSGGSLFLSFSPLIPSASSMEGQGSGARVVPLWRPPASAIPGFPSLALLWGLLGIWVLMEPHRLEGEGYRVLG